MADRWTILLLLGGTLLTVQPAAQPVEGAHAADHRYVVLGYVRDGEGRPIARRPVLLVREKTGLPYHAETDARGFYLLIVHLHDEDLLDQLQVLAGGGGIRVAVWFDPLNPERPRGTRVDFAGGQARERPDLFVPTLEEFLQR